MDRTTQALAAQLGLQPHSIRSRLSRTGSYFGVRPHTLPNGRLLWPPDAFEQIISASRPPLGARVTGAVGVRNRFSWGRNGNR
jgi:hypothetical protein